MLQKTQGIVLHTLKYSETSVITSIYTRNFGQLSFIVQGVRTSKSKNKAALLQPMNMLDIEVYLRENKNLLRLKEFRMNYIYERLTFDMVKSAVGFFYVEILNKVIKEQEANVELFDFITNEFKLLDTYSGTFSPLPLLFLVRLSSFLGFLPHNNYSDSNMIFDMKEGYFTNQIPAFNLSISPPLSLSFYKVLLAANNKMVFPTMNYNERKELLDQLLKYYALHISNFRSINTIKVLEEVLG
jgi:DNA repair protein RecO (recombination protein O)